MTKEKIELFKEDFRKANAFNLEDKFLPENPLEVDAFINRVEMIVEQEIMTRCPRYVVIKNDISENQKNAIWNAIIEQAQYMIAIGDVNLMSGYDPVTNQITPINELRKRRFSPLAKVILTNSGLFYRGITNRRGSKYMLERSTWR